MKWGAVLGGLGASNWDCHVGSYVWVLEDLLEELGGSVYDLRHSFEGIERYLGNRDEPH